MPATERILHILQFFSKVRVPNLACIIKVRPNHIEVQLFQGIWASRAIEASVRVVRGSFWSIEQVAAISVDHDILPEMSKPRYTGVLRPGASEIQWTFPRILQQM